MICKDRMFLVAGNVDDSIKSQTSVYDVTLFSSFVSFERYVNETPVIMDTLILTTNDLPFTGTNMVRLMNLLGTPFVKVTGSIVYLVDKSYNPDLINTFLNEKGLTNWAVYQGDLSAKFITEIVNGSGRESVEGQTEIVTYRIRASEYRKQQTQAEYQAKYQTDDNKYLTDEDLLSGIPDVEESEDINPSTEQSMSVNYVVGGNYMERTLMVFFLAQYLSLSNKTIIVEKDYEYHTLTEMVTKSEVEHEFISIDDIYDDVTAAISRINESPKKLIVVGCVSRREFDYNFIIDILMSNTKGYVVNVIRECHYKETPYGRYYTVVVPNTVPEVLKCCNSLIYDINPEHTTFVGMQTTNVGPVNINSKEMKAIISSVLSKEAVAVQLLKSNGIILKGDGVVYDILSILNRANCR